jgi:hypothetical protein
MGRRCRGVLRHRHAAKAARPLPNSKKEDGSGVTVVAVIDSIVFCHCPWVVTFAPKTSLT